MKKIIKQIGLLAACNLALLLPVKASTFANITIDGGFTDWTGIASIATDGTGDGDPADFVTLYAANDADNLYLRVVYNSAVAVNAGGAQIFIAIDNDNNTATGFDVFGLGAIGSEIGWQNDFPFQQATGVFNTGGSITDGAASLSPISTTVTEQEISISRSATFTTGGASIFPNSTIAIAMYSDSTTVNDFIGASTYTFAVPEPSQAALLLALGALGVTIVRRRR